MSDVDHVRGVARTYIRVFSIWPSASHSLPPRCHPRSDSNYLALGPGRYNYRPILN